MKRPTHQQNIHSRPSARDALVPTGIRQFSTESVEPARALDLWVATLDKALVQSSRDSTERTTFSGRASSLAVGDLGFTQVQATCQDVYRTAAHIARAAEVPSFLVCDVASNWHMRQGSEYVQLRPGDLLLVDSAAPYELHFRSPVNTLIVELPKCWLGQWLVKPESAAPRKILRDVGWGKSLSAMFQQFHEQLDLAHAYPPDMLCDHLGAMLAAATEPRPADHPADAKHGIAQAAKQAMRRQLDRSGLSAACIARELGISVRTLHRAFGSQNSTFLTSLRQMRLELAAELLRQPRLGHLSVASVGLRCGYSDPSHFSREFRRAWGLAPAQWRAASHPA